MQTTQLCPPAVLAAVAASRAALEQSGGVERAALARAAEAALIVGSLTEETELAVAVLACPALALEETEAGRLARLVGAGPAQLAASLRRIGEVGLPPGWSPTQGLDARQAEVLRKMLLATVSDPRLVLARLAQQLALMRHARELDALDRDRAALETRVLYAPLASRLGVWQLKWELEDLAFRYLEPEAYRRIAAALNERRADRERYISEVCATLEAALAASGIEAEIYGRPKHMYSIHRKMQRKQLAFEQLFDLRAVRIVVASVRDCYAALGIVHGLWSYIPGEFDDYIATPKPNGYRSIHTAVIGPQGRSLEVQIRTREMHEHAELGVAAHWTYKEGGPADRQYQRKVEWVRRLLEPHAAGEDAGGGERDFLEHMRAELFEDRVYALTPKGEVVDLPRGATPLDFAYQVHTSLGHRCRGAKVNGRIVPLTTALGNGQIVEIIVAREEAPSRDWTAPEQGFLASPRHRAKVRSWFRKQDVGSNVAAGKAMLERELARFRAGPEHFAPLIQELRARDAVHLYQLLGEGEISLTQLTQAAARLLEPVAAQRPAHSMRPKRRAGPRRSSPVVIEGESDLPVTLAHCCAPLPPQPIVGYVTLGRGVTVHRSDCPGLRRMSASRPERLVRAEWSELAAEGLSAQVSITAHDRPGLVRDVTDVLAAERLNIEALNTTTDRKAASAHVLVSFAVTDLQQLARVLRRLSGVPSVTSARRVH